MVCWQSDNGAPYAGNGVLMELSRAGARVELSEAVRVGTFVTFRVDRLRFQGSASVRYCLRKGLKHVLGLEFAGGLEWKEPTNCATPERELDLVQC